MKGMKQMPQKKTKGRQTLVSFLLDQSGSMEKVKGATISGFNEYIQTLQQNGGDLLFTLTKFNSTATIIAYNAEPLKAVDGLSEQSYHPSANTPLYDAIAATVKATEQKLASEKKKPNVLFIIMTDGEENDSHEYNREQVMQLIREKESVGWTFTYLGANQDAWRVGASIGVAVGNVANFNQAQTGQTMSVLASATGRYAKAVSAAPAAFGHSTHQFYSGYTQDSLSVSDVKTAEKMDIDLLSHTDEAEKSELVGKEKKRRRVLKSLSGTKIVVD